MSKKAKKLGAKKVSLKKIEWDYNWLVGKPLSQKLTFGDRKRI